MLSRLYFRRGGEERERRERWWGGGERGKGGGRKGEREMEGSSQYQAKKGSRVGHYGCQQEGICVRSEAREMHMHGHIYFAPRLGKGLVQPSLSQANL